MGEGIKILIIRLSAIGDTIHTLPLACALRKKYPEAKIDWLVEDKASQFVVNNPVIDDVFIIPRKEWKKRGFSPKNFDEFNKIIAKLKKQKYDIAIDTQQLLKSAVYLKLCGAKRKIALSGGREFSGLFANEIIPASHKLFDNNYHVVYRNLEIAQYLGCEDTSVEFVLPDISEKEKAHVDKLLENIDSKKPTIILSPATTWETKHWVNQYWAEIIKEYEQKANIIITGTKLDKELIKDILLFGKFKKIINIAGKTNLNELAEIFRRADVVVAPDSGSAQIAWACQKPLVVSIFTATSKNRTAPFGENTVSISPEIDCYPCHKKRCFSKNFELCKIKVNYYEVIKILNKLFE